MQSQEGPPARAPGVVRRWLAPPWMTRDVAIVTWARVPMSAARALGGIATPIYLALLGFSAVRLGVLFLAIAAVSTLLSTAVGLLSDRFGRRPFLVGLPLLAAGAGVVFSLRVPEAALWLAAMVGTLGRGAGAGGGVVGPYYPAEQALAADHTAAGYRNAVFGRLAFSSAIGGLGGALLAQLAGSHHPAGVAAVATFRPVYIAVAALAASSGIAALWLSPEPRRLPEPGRTFLPRRSLGLLVRLWVTNGVNGIAVGMFAPFITYWFFVRFGAGAGTIGRLYAVINLVTMASILSAARVARRLGLVRTIIGGRIVQAILLIPMALAPSFTLAGAIYLLRMIAQRLSMPLRQSFVMAAADPAERGSVAALSNIPSQATSASSPALAGFLFEHVSLALPFELAGGLQLLNAILFYAFFRGTIPDEERLVAAAPPEPVEGGTGPPADAEGGVP